MMNTKKITIRVDSEVADMYHSSSEEEKLKLDALLSSKLHEFSRLHKRSTSLEEIMDQMSHNAQKRGLTPEKLDKIC